DDASPDVVGNCAAHTRVDACEREEAEAFRLNAHAVEGVANAARERDALVVHFSTDYVFDGATGRAYVEEDTPNPLSVYGKSKLEGERLLRLSAARFLLVRTQWLYGPGERNFVHAIVT